MTPFTRILLPFAATFIGTWATSPVRAELTWPTRTIELRADPAATVLEARFRFNNDGASPVDIGQVQTSCGCTTAALAQRHYEPGQGGEIVARYTIGSSIGLQTKTLLVSLVGQPVPVTLTLVARLSEWLRIQPRFVTWTLGEAATPKTLILEPTEAAAPPPTITVQSSNSALRAELQPSAGKDSKYQLTVTPANTHRPLFASLTIHARFGATEKTFHAFASVQPAPPNH